MKTIVLTGGGTAGHVMPNLALLPELKKSFDRIVYIGTDGIEKKLALENGLEFIEICAPKFIRKLTFKNLSIPYNLLKSISSTKKILRELNPNIIFSKGGYVSIPVAIAGNKLNIPVLTHESDLSLGLANKIINKFSKLTLTSFEQTGKNKSKFIYSGSPVRNQIFNGKKLNIFNNSKKTILFFGGSLGAKAINETVFNNLDKLTKKYNILHITGKGKNKIEKTENYFSIEYVNNIEDYFATADYVVSRAGANSIFELLSLNKATLFIPLSKAESRGDQIDNASYFYSRGACEMLLQENLNYDNLINSINKLENNIESIKNNIKKLNLKNTNKKIVEIINNNIK